MSKFVQFFADGVVYERDKKDRPCGIKSHCKESGVVFDGREIMGTIFMQCPDLLRCDWVDVETCPIG